jgi:hypothetical protein
LREVPAARTRALLQPGIGGIKQLVRGRFTAFPVEAVKGIHLGLRVEEAPKADQVTRKPKVILAPREKQSPCDARAVLEQQKGVEADTSRPWFLCRGFCR